VPLGDVIGLAPVPLGAVPPIILPPDPAQDGAGGHLPPPRRGLWVIDGREPSPAIGPNGPREGCLGGGRCGEPIILSPPRVAVPPVGVTHRAPPLGGDDGERMQGLPPRVAHHLEAVEGPHRREPRGGVRPLPTPRLDELAGAAPGA
jgi:hypothetical protein